MDTFRSNSHLIYYKVKVYLNTIITDWCRLSKWDVTVMHMSKLFFVFSKVDHGYHNVATM